MLEKVLKCLIGEIFEIEIYNRFLVAVSNDHTIGIVAKLDKNFEKKFRFSSKSIRKNFSGLEYNEDQLIIKRGSEKAFVESSKDLKYKSLIEDVKELKNICLNGIIDKKHVTYIKSLNIPFVTLILKRDGITITGIDTSENLRVEKPFSYGLFRDERLENLCESEITVQTNPLLDLLIRLGNAKQEYLIKHDESRVFFIQNNFTIIVSKLFFD